MWPTFPPCFVATITYSCFCDVWSQLGTAVGQTTVHRDLRNREVFPLTPSPTCLSHVCACICCVSAPLELYLEAQILQHHGECGPGPGQGSPFALPCPLQLLACVMWQLSFSVRVNSVLKQSESFCYITALKCCSSSSFLPIHNILGLLGLWIRKLGFRVYEFHSAYRLGCRGGFEQGCVVFHCDHGSFSEAPFSHLPLLSLR